VAASNFTHGTVGTLAMLKWLVHHGCIPASSGVASAISLAAAQGAPRRSGMALHTCVITYTDESGRP